ncbi:MAG: hypothetical protein Q4C05_07970 [Akkermansia sp.]|nr:hypothetical protein [Akkermansia sp.]
MSHHRHTSIAIMSALLLVGTPLHAENAGTTPPPSQVSTTEATEKAEDQGISTPRRIAGFGVLAFLIGWMIWRNNGKQNSEKAEAPTPPEQGE